MDQPKNMEEKSLRRASFLTTILVKISRSRLSFLYFLPHFYFIFHLFPYLLFVELRARDNHMTQEERYRMSELQEVGLALFLLFSIFLFFFSI